MPSERLGNVNNLRRLVRKLEQRVRRGALARAASRTYHLDLGRRARLQDERGTQFTPALHACYALVEAPRVRELRGRG